MNVLMGEKTPAASTNCKQVEFKHVDFWKAVWYFVLFISGGD